MKTIKTIIILMVVLAASLLGACKPPDPPFSPDIPPETPSNLFATAIADTAIQLTWSDNSDDEDGFKIEQSRWESGPFAEVLSVNAGDTLVYVTNLEDSTYYYFRVRAFNSGGYSAYSNMAYAKTHSRPSLPAAPSNLQASSTSGTTIHLIWKDNSNNEDGFKIFQSYERFSGYSEVAAVGKNDTCVTINNLQVGSLYCFRIRAYNAAGLSGISNTISAMTNPGWPPPPAPSDLQAVAISTTAVQLSWKDNSSNELGFRVEKSQGSSSAFFEAGKVEANVTVDTVFNLNPNTLYYFRVRAYKPDICSDYSNITSVRTDGVVIIPMPPSGLWAKAESSSQINLSWFDSSDNETSFKIERSTTSSIEGFSQIAAVGANVSTYSDMGLSPGTRYWYRVRAANSAGNSAYTDPADAVTQSIVTLPAAPTGLSTATASSWQILLFWTDNANNETGFKIERSTISSTSGFSQIATVGVDVSTYSDNGLSPGTHYWYRVRATNSAGNSGYSNVTDAITNSVVTIPVAPSNLSTTAASSSKIDIEWTDNSNNETGFKIERSSTSGTSGFIQIATVGSDICNYISTGLNPGTRYWYRVCATNSAGDSEYSNVDDATTHSVVTIPVAPSNLSATAASSSQINLSWIDNSDNETGFKIERSTTSNTSGFSQIATVGSNVCTYSNTGLGPGGHYWYRVRAYNSAGNSGYSNVDDATTGIIFIPPEAPTGLSATAVSSSQINLSWTDHSNTETGFKIERSTTSGTSGFSQIGTVGSNIRAYSSTGLSSGMRYWYRVRAFNSAGDSDYSNVADAVTQNAEPITVYAAYDNSVMYDSTDPSCADKVFPNQALMVGYDYLPLPNGAHDVQVGASAIKFDVQSRIANRSIAKATLRIYVFALRGDFSITPQIRVRALATDWSPATLTYNKFTNLQYYLSGQVTMNAPSNGVIPLDFDVTTIVRNWASGVFQNFGFQLIPVFYEYFGRTSLGATLFQSLEYNYGSNQRPQLIIEFQ